MKSLPKSSFIIRELTSSDLGWFAECRDSGAIASKQRAINFNYPVVAATLPARAIRTGEVLLRTQCLLPGVDNTIVDRPLGKTGKNWRLGGRKVFGKAFSEATPGDLFVCRLTVAEKLPYDLKWTMIMRTTNPANHAKLVAKLQPRLRDRMAVFSEEDDLLVLLFESLLQPVNELNRIDESPSGNGQSPKINPIAKRATRRLAVQERLKQPHIVAELVKLSISHSAQAQRDYIQALELLAENIRAMLEAAGLIGSLVIDHQTLWNEVSGRAISFVDGGMANLAAIGAEPVAIRVGSYTVVPGVKDAGRESFRMEKQLVAELFDLDSANGIFEDHFEDPAKLREAARFCLELAGGIQALSGNPRPEFLFLHGAMVNPVSAYSDRDFPPFSKRGLELLLPDDAPNKMGREACFVSVYLRLLQILQNSGANVGSVVERASQSTIVSRALLEKLKNSDFSPGSSVIENAIRRIQEFRFSDATLFQTILNEGEYLVPIPVDRNVKHKRPQFSADIIDQYPQPWATYLGVGEFAQPLRIEFLHEPQAGFEFCLRLLLHSCRLMPNYSFPVGLDIIDKFAKVPNWMSRPIASGMAVQLLKRAMDTGNPKVIEAAKQMLCGTRRDWLFRPTFSN